MSEWKEIKLKDICKFKYGKMPPESIKSDTGYPIYSGYGITGYANEYLYEKPMLVVVARGVGGTGDVKISPKESWITNLSIVLNVDEDKVNKYFLRDLLGLLALKEKLDSGSAQSQITIDSLSPFKITLPPFGIQNKIARILSNYDDLIENNLKRIKLLEESVRLTYEEWFLRFRIDGKKLKIDSETSLPFGWEKKKLTDVIYLNPLTAIARGTEQPFIPMGSLSVTSMLIDDVQMRIPKGGTRFKNLDTLLARITPSLENGKTGFVQCLKEDEVASGSTEFIVMRATEEISPYYVYPLARTADFREIAIQSMSGSDGRQRVKVKVFEKILLNIPTEEIQNKYHFSMKKIFDEIQVLANQNQLLKEARDILLPRLMTGMIDVEDMEIAL